jgi:DNA-directed RNA polymerase specialized sigma24 family protein
MTEREQLLDELRPAAFAIAYRMLGSVSEADDVAQEALLRVHQAPAHRTKQRVDAHTDPRREADDDSPGNQQQSDDETLR